MTGATFIAFTSPPSSAPAGGPPGGEGDGREILFDRYFLFDREFLVLGTMHMLGIC